MAGLLNLALSSSSLADLFPASHPFCRQLLGPALSPEEKFAAWKEIQISDLLPEEIIERYRNSGAPLTMKIEVVGTDTRVEILYPKTTEPEPVLHFHLLPGSRPELIRVENLRMADPLADEERSHSLRTLHPSQERKSFSGRGFQYLAGHLKALFGFQGFSAIEMKASQNYLVSALYRRGVGRVILSDESQALYQSLDRFYPLAAKLPEDIKAKSMDEFTQILGDGSFSDPALVNLEAVVQATGGWQNPSSRVMAAYGLEIHRLDDGTPWFVVSRRDGRKVRAEPLRGIALNLDGLVQVVDWHILHTTYAERMRFEILLR